MVGKDPVSGHGPAILRLPRLRRGGRVAPQGSPPSSPSGAPRRAAPILTVGDVLRALDRVPARLAALLVDLGALERQGPVRGPDVGAPGHDAPTRGRASGDGEVARRRCHGVGGLGPFPGAAVRAWLGGRGAFLDGNPLSGMRGPPRPGRGCTCRRGPPPARDRRRAWRGAGIRRRDAERLHQAEQIRLLVRLAADSGARRGELAALASTTSTEGCSRSSAASRPSRSAPRRRGGSDGSHSALRRPNLWRECEGTWPGGCPRRRFGPWLFSAEATPPGAAHRGRDGSLVRGVPCREAGLPGVTLHRLRHTVATFLVGRGELLRAQQRLGHRDASTTLRNYAHALPLED